MTFGFVLGVFLSDFVERLAFLRARISDLMLIVAEWGADLEFLQGFCSFGVLFA